MPKQEAADAVEDMEDAGGIVSFVVRARGDGPRSRASLAGKVEPQEGTLCGICRDTLLAGAWTNAGSRLHPCFRHRECHAAAKRLDTAYSVRPQFSWGEVGLSGERLVTLISLAPPSFTRRSTTRAVRSSAASRRTRRSFAFACWSK